ncbi:MAG: FAD-dependent oxidoreductase [Bacilli bacterium]|nr:FAD-dependent oxidoreductase [Bacilli bacterium]
MSQDFDSVIIGAGVAGMTSAIYLKRYNVNVLLLEKNIPGGQIVQTPKIENYPGVGSIDGASLALNMYQQVTDLGIECRYSEVIKIENHGNSKTIYTENEEIRTKTIIIATGRIPKKLGLENESELTGRGISWCATCDGMFYKNQDVAVIGGGNSALEEALFLSDICNKIYILYRSGELRADKILQKRVFEKENIEIKFDTIVEKINEKDEKLESIIIKEREEEKKLVVQGMFIYIGFEPNDSIISELNLILKNQYIVVNENMETNIKGIYACGDIIKKELYQVTTAVGEGSIAANSVKKYLMQ